MEASDLCLIIDNTQSYLRDWLAMAKPWGGHMTADTAELHFRFRMKATGMSAPGFRREVLNLVTERIDWQEVATHYNIKVQEGTTA
jgi:hypothetical protein